MTVFRQPLGDCAPVTETATTTPISKTPITPTNALDWATATVDELDTQLSGLTQRYYTALSLGRQDIATALERAIIQLQHIIEYKGQHHGQHTY